MFTSPDDVRSRWVLDIEFPVTDQVVETLIEDVEDTIETRLPGTLERVTTGVIPATRLRKIVARVIIRQLRNPEGLRTVQESTGPFSQSITRGGDEPGELYLADGDLAELAEVKTKRRAFTVDTAVW